LNDVRALVSFANIPLGTLDMIIYTRTMRIPSPSVIHIPRALITASKKSDPSDNPTRAAELLVVVETGATLVVSTERDGVVKTLFRDKKVLHSETKLPSSAATVTLTVKKHWLHIAAPAKIGEHEQGRSVVAQRDAESISRHAVVQLGANEPVAPVEGRDGVGDWPV